MKKQKNKANVIRKAMQECFEEIGIPNLSSNKALENSIHCQENLVVSGIRFRYEEEYYNRAIVDTVAQADIPAEKVGPLKELLNLINIDLGVDHFSYIPENNTLMFGAAFYIYGDHLPRNKFKKFLSTFFRDYYRHIPIIECLRTKGGNPYDLMESHADHNIIGLDATLLKDRTVYTQLKYAIEKVFSKSDISLSEVEMGNNSLFLVSRGILGKRQVAFSVCTLKHRGQLYLQIFCPEALPESMIPGAIEMANIFNSHSYVNHFYIIPWQRYVVLASGVILDRKLDEKELENQLAILLVTAREFLPVFMGEHPANISAPEHLRAIMARASA